MRRFIVDTDTASDDAPEHAVAELIRRFENEPGELELITLGPLTNIATALSIEPRLASWVKHCYVMGGAAATLGNVTPAAEYNFWCDPEAAQRVLQSGMNLTLLGWELSCNDSALSDTEIANIEALGTARARLAIDSNRLALNALGMRPTPTSALPSTPHAGSPCSAAL